MFVRRFKYWWQVAVPTLFFGEAFDTRLELAQRLWHRQSCVLERISTLQVECPVYGGSIRLKDLQWFNFCHITLLALLRFLEAFVEFLTIFLRLLLHPNASLISHPMVSHGNEPSCFTDCMKLADLMGSLRPEVSDRLQFPRDAQRETQFSQAALQASSAFSPGVSRG